VPPTSEYKTNENESVPSASKEQIRATPNHHHDTSTLQNNKKNAMKKSPRVLYTVFAGRKNRMLLQEPYWAEMHQLGQIDQVHLWNYTLNNRFMNGNFTIFTTRQSQIFICDNHGTQSRGNARNLVV
jgi:hypothetical protein